MELLSKNKKRKVRLCEMQIAVCDSGRKDKYLLNEESVNRFGTYVSAL